MKYVYPAVFTPIDGGEYDIEIPDLPGCRTCGKDLADAIAMAEDAVEMWLCDAEDKNEVIPAASPSLSVSPPQFVNFVVADTISYRQKNDFRSVRKTLSLPAWLATKAEQAGISLSATLQSALKDQLGMDGRR